MGVRSRILAVIMAALKNIVDHAAFLICVFPSGPFKTRSIFCVAADSDIVLN